MSERTNYFDTYSGFGDDDPPPNGLPTNHGQPWSERGDHALIALLKSKWPLEAIASKLGRSLTAIEMRIEWLATADERKKKLAGYISKLTRGGKSQ